MSAQEIWVAFLTIVVREVRRFTRIWVQTLLPPAITMALYFVIFGSLIGSRIGVMGGYDYMQYIVPGLVMMAIITNAYANVVSSFFSIKFQHSIEELLVSPVPNNIILGGFVAGGVIRGMMVGVIVTALSLPFAHLEIHNFGIMLLVVFLTTIVFSLGGFINAIYATKFDDISVVPTFILTPLTYFGGVFYSLDMLPPFWQTLSLVNPIVYMVNAYRYGILGVSDVPVGLSIGMLCLFACGLYLWAITLLNRGTGIRK